MELINQLAENYVSVYTSKQHSLLEEIEDFTSKNHAYPHMLSGNVQGRVLAMISKILQPKRILEIGTFTGFSALCLAEGLQKDGILHTIDIRAEDAEIAKKYILRSDFSDKVKIHIGDAKDIIPNLKENWDLVFIDADKTGYIDYYNLTLPFLNQNGIIIADNVLFYGEILKEQITGKSAKAIHEFNKLISEDNRVEQVMLTIRDGLLIIRKV
jgi:caffeoyl-CoA O-methyltransferase